jgi:2-polyprenyl-6-methoxyphenol hydroxylase-like FAD-dependent oxidoreductase
MAAGQVAVLVVGAGPTGLTMAVELARRGVAVRIIEQLAVPALRAHAVRTAPNVRIGQIIGAGHFAHRDAPTEFATSVLRAVANSS